MKKSVLYFFLFFLLFGNSCVTHESLISFQEGVPTTALEEILNQADLRIQPNDLLRIQVHSINEKAAAPFNIEKTGQGGGQMMMGQQGGAGMERFMGYYVDRDGTIDFPVVGRIDLRGLTIPEAKIKVETLVKPYLTDAVINMRFLNFKVTLLGEVNAPGVLQLSNQRVTLLEALGQAGDLTNYARRDNILIMREIDGQRTYQRLNLQDYNLFQSPYFYLQQNDVIYVEPRQEKVVTIADPIQRIIGYGSSALSLIALIIALTK